MEYLILGLQDILVCRFGDGHDYQYDKHQEQGSFSCNIENVSEIIMLSIFTFFN